MRKTYTAYLRLPDGRVWHSLDYDIDVSLEQGPYDPEPYIFCHDVLVDVSEPREPSEYVSMFCETATPAMRAMGQEIRTQVETDRDLLGEVIQEEREAA